MKKAQVAIEYMMIIGMILAILIPLSVYVWNQNEISNRARQAEIAVEMIAKTADNIYAQGPGSKTQITVYIPIGYVSEDSYINNKTIFLKLFTPAGYGDVIALTKAKVNGTMPANSGYNILNFELVNGIVNVS